MLGRREWAFWGRGRRGSSARSERLGSYWRWIHETLSLRRTAFSHALLRGRDESAVRLPGQPTCRPPEPCRRVVLRRTAPRACAASYWQSASEALIRVTESESVVGRQAPRDHMP